MKIIRYNPKTCVHRTIRKSEPMIRFSSQNVILFTPAAVQMLNLSPGSMVEFVQDEAHRKDWYICTSPFGYQLRAKKAALIMSGKHLCDTIRDSIGMKKGPFSLRVCKDPVIEEDLILHGLITKPI